MIDAATPKSSPEASPHVVSEVNELAAERLTPAMLRGTLIEEILRTRGFKPDGWLRKSIEPVVAASINHFIGITFEFDRICAEQGFMAAARWMLPQFARGVEVNGVEEIPVDGPLLLLSNHPGSFDEVVIGATVPRADLRIFANSHPILTSFPAISRHAVYSKAGDPQASMRAVRNGIKNLRAGGTLVLFPNGRTDPDPRRIPGAREAIETWSPSVELMVNKAPETRVVIAMVSGVTSPVLMRLPGIHLRRPQIERQKLAQTVQLALQMLFPRLFNLTPRITFSPPQTLEELTAGGAQSARQGMIAVAQQMLELHSENAPAPQLLTLGA